MLVYVSRVSVIVECPRFSWTTFAGHVRPQWCSPGSDPNLGGSEPCGVGRSVVELGLRVALGGDPAPVVLDLPLDPRGVPAQDRRDDVGDLAGDVATAVPGADRHPQPAGQQVVEVQRALVRGAVVRLDLEVARGVLQG